MAGKVSVGCKLPHGLVLRVFNMIERDVPVMGGGSRTEKIAEQRAETATVHGWAHAQNAAPNCTIIGGYAITDGVDKDLWELWLSQNKNSDMVKAGLIFANEKSDSVSGKAKDGKDVRSGLERLDPAKMNGRIKTDKDLMGREIVAKIS